MELSFPFYRDVWVVVTYSITNMRCRMDGHTFTGGAILVPTKYSVDRKEFQYENLVFCSPSCAKGWIFQDVRRNTDQLHLFSLYCRQVLGLSDPVEICTDPRFLQSYMSDPSQGLTIEQFRSRHPTRLLVTAYQHIHPWVDQSIKAEEITRGSGQLDVSLYIQPTKEPEMDAISSTSV